VQRRVIRFAIGCVEIALSLSMLMNETAADERKANRPSGGGTENRSLCIINKPVICVYLWHVAHFQNSISARRRWNAETWNNPERVCAKGKHTCLAFLSETVGDNFRCGESCIIDMLFACKGQRVYDRSAVALVRWSYSGFRPERLLLSTYCDAKSSCTTNRGILMKFRASSLVSFMRLRQNLIKL
jgi:hypothetical protein